jgi:nucleoside-diphosphate-sugar epimerase
MMKVMVTGGTGFIGSRLTHFLCRKNYKVRVLCRPASDVSVFGDDPVDIREGDILDIASVAEAVKGCDYVFHLAGYARNWARDPGTFFRVNVEGTDNVLSACRRAGVKKAVMTSTCVTLGASSLPRREFQRRTDGFYCEYERTKFLAERLASNYAASGLPVVTVNPTRVFGPGLLNEGNSVTKMIALYLQGKWRTVLGDGPALGNYAFVDDVVKGHWLALLKGKPGEKYVLGGENLSYAEFYRRLGVLSGRHRRMIHVPIPAALVFAGALQAWAKTFRSYPLISQDWVRVFAADWAFSSAKAEKELGYRITPFPEALWKTLDWLQGTALGQGRIKNETAVKYS